jgi:hypothetical protein
VEDWSEIANELMTECLATFGGPVVWRFGGSGYGLVVTGAFYAPTDSDPFGPGTIKGPAYRIDVLQDALPHDPRKSDTVDIPKRDGTWRRYRTTTSADQDVERTIWTLPLEEIGMATPSPALALTILRTAEGDRVDDVNLWAPATVVAIGPTSVMSPVVDLQYDRLVMYQADRTCWLAYGSVTLEAVVDGTGCIRLEAGSSIKLVVRAGDRVAAICGPGMTGHLRQIPAL